MRKVFGALALAAGLSGCAASIPPVEVTRFHLSQAITPAPVRTEADSTLETTPYVAAVSQAMAGIGFADAPVGGQPVYIAKVVQTRTTREVEKRSPISIGIGGGSFGRNVGVGVGTSVGLGGGLQKIVYTRLSVQLIRKTDGVNVWEGRAETSAPLNAPAAQPGLAAKKLADALFKGFPGTSGQTITVK